MRNFLEELYFGNLDPQARGYRKDSHILKVSEKSMSWKKNSRSA